MGDANNHANNNVAERKVTVRNETGLHLRPARLFVDKAGEYTSDIRVARGDQTVNGKSIMELLALAALPESTLTIRAQGPDADAAVQALAALVEGGFSTDA